MEKEPCCDGPWLAPPADKSTLAEFVSMTNAERVARGMKKYHSEACDGE